MADYANPNVLADADWVADHMGDPAVKLVRADRNVDPLESPSIPGSAIWLWEAAMQHPKVHDIPDQQGIEALLGRSGISNGDTVVLYGGANSWYACFAFWLLKIYGHEDARVLPGPCCR